ncbi:MAG: hypothetical protein ABI947_17265 [Chloroflexota bacterium]
MTVPNGTLVSESTQTKAQAGRTFVIWTLATLAFFLIVYALSTFGPEDTDPQRGNDAICYSIALLPAIGMILAGLNLFQQRKKLEIYTDGFILRNAKDGNNLESALWREVNDITWSQDRQRTTNRTAGYLFFGIIGALIASSLSETTWENSKRDLYIKLANKKKITLDISFEAPQKPNVPLMNETRKAWLAEAIQSLRNGKDVAFGNLLVTVAGVKQGDKFVEWKAIIEAKSINQDGKVGIVWTDPSKKKPQIMSVRLGLRGNALVQLVNKRVEKNIGLSTRLGNPNSYRS